MLGGYICKSKDYDDEECNSYPDAKKKKPKTTKKPGYHHCGEEKVVNYVRVCRVNILFK